MSAMNEARDKVKNEASSSQIDVPELVKVVLIRSRKN